MLHVSRPGSRIRYCYHNRSNESFILICNLFNTPKSGDHHKADIAFGEDAYVDERAIGTRWL
jgi:hypothetical protein